MGRRLWGQHVLIERIERQQLFDDARALDPVSMTLTGAALDVCDQLYQQQAGRCRVGIRRWPFDGDDYMAYDAVERAEWELSQGYLHITRYLVNEPAADDDLYIWWLEDFLGHLAERLRKGLPIFPVTFGLFASGTPGDGTIESGRYDKVFRLAAEIGAWVSYHVYGMAHLAADGMGGIMDLKQAWDIARWDWDTMPDWHVKRFLRAVKQCEKLGITLNFEFNEFLYDTWPDVQGRDDYRNLAWRFNGGQAIRGYWSGYDQMCREMTGMDGETFTIKMLEWFVAHLPDCVKAIHPFVCADFDPQNTEQWATMYGITGRKTPRLWAWMCEQNKEAVPMAWKLATVSTNKRVNMRDDASTTATVLGQFTGSRQFYVFDNGVVRNSVHWALFSPNADGSQSFFMAIVDADGTQLLDIVYDPTPAPQPDPAPDTVTLTITLTAEQMATLRDSVDAWRAVWEQVFPQVKGWED